MSVGYFEALVLQVLDNIKKTEAHLLVIARALNLELLHRVSLLGLFCIVADPSQNRHVDLGVKSQHLRGGVLFNGLGWKLLQAALVLLP